MKKVYINENFKHILHGGDYNPDQWLDRPDILDEDMRLMRLAHCNTMTVGIFSWVTLEPQEGKFDFSFLDKTIDDVYKNGGRVILATPSGARPAWLSQKYPEVCRVNDKNQNCTHGRRENHCYTSPIYREKVAIINRKLAERYGKHPAVYAWHLSNEYSGVCHCPLCKEAFRGWLKEKYGTLDALNHEWWTAFWSHTYTDWSQIDPPSPLGESSVNGLTVDWQRFCTHQTTDFMKHEIKTVKEIAPHLPVTTNLMGLYHILDYRVMAKELDFISWDCYGRWSGDNQSDIEVASYSALQHDLNRSFLHKPFLLMESTPSHVNWHTHNKLKRPGQHMISSLQAVAHGSDSVLYFQWRKSRGANEQFHGAVVDHLGTENTRVFREVSALGERLEALDEIVGTRTDSRVAVIYDWSNRWLIDAAQGFQKDNKKVKDTLCRFYKPLWDRGINTDIIGYEDDFSRYDVIIAPMLFSIPEDLIDKIEAFVKNGGTILGTYMTGMVNENGLCYLGGFPAGKLKEVFGIWNEEIDTLHDHESNSVEMNGKSYRAVDYCEVIHPRGAKTLATYTDDFYSGEAAATANQYGNGKAYYIAFRNADDFHAEIIDRILKEKQITSEFDGALPNGVTAHSRTDGENLFVFLENFSNVETKTSTAHLWHTVDTKQSVTGEISLAPYETLILKRKI